MSRPIEYQTPKVYDYDSCDECGECLSLCPVMNLSAEEARREIHSLREGLACRTLRDCTSCLDCDFFCPKDCNPGELILNTWGRISREQGRPARARYFIPNSEVNFRTYVIDRMGTREKELLRSWASLSPAKEMCFPGCNAIVTPLITQTRALAGLDIRGALEYCCGEMYLRMGLFDQVRQLAKKTSEYFDTLGAEKVIMLCPACNYMFAEVLPHFGGEYHFEMESLLAYLLRKLQRGELEFAHPLNLSVTIQDSCYGKQFGPEYLDIAREILTRAGCEVIEMENSRERMLCCGIGSGYSPLSAFNPLKLTAATLKLIGKAKKSGAEAVATYCSGCLQMLSAGLVVYRTGLPVYHLLQLVGMALGETIEPFNGRRLLEGTLRNQLPRLLDPRRFHVPDIVS